MWVFTDDGFYSAVKHRELQGYVLVRGRVFEDMQRLAAFIHSAGYGDTASPIEDTPKADYPYRMAVPHWLWGQYLTRKSALIDYTNFKEHVAAKQSPARAHAYGEVWADLLDLESKL